MWGEERFGSSTRHTTAARAQSSKYRFVVSRFQEYQCLVFERLAVTPVGSSIHSIHTTPRDRLYLPVLHQQPHAPWHRRPCRHAWLHLRVTGKRSSHHTAISTEAWSCVSRYHHTARTHPASTATHLWAPCINQDQTCNCLTSATLSILVPHGARTCGQVPDAQQIFHAISR